MARTSATYRSFDADTLQPASPSRFLIWFAIAAMLLSLPLSVNIVGRLQEEAKVRAEVERVENLIQSDETCLRQLGGALEYVKSDDYTERWARERARLARPGETAVIPATTETLAQPSPWWEGMVKCR
jgi:hypothetical protein